MSTETPRTDRVVYLWRNGGSPLSLVDECRALERDLSRVTEEMDAALHRTEKLAATLELERNAAESVHRVLRGTLGIGPEGNVMTAIEHLKAERVARLKMHDEMERQAQLATEARMDRDAALRRVREIEVSALATLQSWDALRSAHDGRDESERRAFADSIAALKARLDVAEKGEKK